MRFSTFIEQFYKWIVDIYHYEPNASGTEIPIVKWNESLERISIQKYIGYSAEKLLIDLAKVDICSLGHDGININNLRYSSDELTEYRKNTPLEQGKKNLQVKVKTIHTSIAEIYVYLDTEKRYIKIPCVDQEYAQGLTLLQHQTNVRFVRCYIKSKTETEHLAEAKVYLHERLMREITEVTNLLNKRKGKISSAKKLAKYHDIGSDNISSLSSNLDSSTSIQKNNKDVSWDDYQPTEDAYE
jgi:putative transposase